MAEKGVSEGALITLVHPAANAGATCLTNHRHFDPYIQPRLVEKHTLRAIIALGKFQGVMRPHTPTGW